MSLGQGVSERHFDAARGLESPKLHCFLLPELDDQENTCVAITEQIFEDSGNISIYQHVFNLLLEGTESATWNWDEDYTITVDELFQNNVFKDVLENLNNVVPHTDRYAKHKYVNLETKLPNFNIK